MVKWRLIFSMLNFASFRGKNVVVFTHYLGKQGNEKKERLAIQFLYLFYAR